MSTETRLSSLQIWFPIHLADPLQKKKKKKHLKTKRKSVTDSEDDLSLQSKSTTSTNSFTKSKEKNKCQNQDIGNDTLDPDVLRWENPCDNPLDEIRRIEVYKANRRLRYLNANNTKVALLAIKQRK